jgi:uncharacterized YccA/Bax inhibitor family protein
VRESSNPVFKSLPKSQGGYAQFGTGAAGYGAAAVQADPYTAQPYQDQQSGASRPLTIDDVVTKTGISLAVLIGVAAVSYFAVMMSPGYALAMPLWLIGMLGGLGLVLFATFGRKMDNPGVVLGYAVFEGMFLGAFSFILANFMVQGISAGALISQAILGTLGVFIGMLVVYKTGAIRVTPKFTRVLVAAMFGVVILAFGNLIFSLFTDGAGPLRDGSPFAYLFSIVCIGIAAFSFLLDFDQADQAIRAGAPAKAAWGIALGLMVTLVWLYTEILWLLSMFNSD